VQKKQIVYKDFWFKIIGSLLASQLIDLLDRQESLFQRFTSIYFYTDMLGGFLIALIIWEVVRRNIRWLDKRYDWQENTISRIILQSILCVALPAFLSFFFTFLFMKLAYQQDIFQTSWLYNEFYAVILIILLINLVYFTWWIFLKWKEARAEKSVAFSTGTILSPALPSIRNIQNPTIEVSKGGKTILLPHPDISYAYLSDGYCYIKIFEGDGFITTYTLDEVARILGDIYFFRVNRQILINRNSCTAYRSVENGKIEIDLNPSFKQPVIVSQKRARDFRKWVSPVAL